MKKFLTLMVAIVVVCALSITAMAAPVSIGYKTYAMGDILANVPQDASTLAEAGFWSQDTSTPITISDGKVTFTTAYAWGAFGYFDDSTVSKGKDGWCYYLQNNGNDTAVLASGFNADNGQGYKLSLDCDYILVDMQGKKTDCTTIWIDGFQQGGIELPAGFEGWVYIPFTSYEINDAASSGTKFDSVNMGVALASFALANISSVSYGGEFYAYTVEQTDSADVSVIAYAAAALTGLGALVVAKKR